MHDRIPAWFVVQIWIRHLFLMVLSQDHPPTWTPGFQGHYPTIYSRPFRQPCRTITCSYSGQNQKRLLSAKLECVCLLRSETVHSKWMSIYRGVRSDLFINWKKLNVFRVWYWSEVVCSFEMVVCVTYRISGIIFVYYRLNGGRLVLASSVHYGDA